MAKHKGEARPSPEVIRKVIAAVTPVCESGPAARRIPIRVKAKDPIEAASIFTTLYVAQLIAAAADTNRPEIRRPDPRDIRFDSHSNEITLFLMLDEIPGYEKLRTSEERAAFLKTGIIGQLEHMLQVTEQRVEEAHAAEEAEIARREQQREQELLARQAKADEARARLAKEREEAEAARRRMEEQREAELARREATEALLPKPYTLPPEQLAGMTALNSLAGHVTRGDNAAMVAHTIAQVAEAVDTKIPWQKTLAEILLDDQAVFAMAQALNVGKPYAGSRYAELAEPSARWAAQEARRDRCGTAQRFFTEHPEAVTLMQELALSTPGLPVLLAAATSRNGQELREAAGFLRESMEGCTFSEYCEIANDKSAPHVLLLKNLFVAQREMTG